LKKVILSVLLAAVAVSLVAVPVFAAPMGKAIPANNNPQNLYLYEKDPDANWAVVAGGAWGKYNYKLSGTGDQTSISGVFNGHGLTVGDNYSLIYYPEVAFNPWPAGGYGVVIIGSAIADIGGNVHITGTATIGSPDNQPAVGDYIGQTGNKIWLVMSSDLTGSVMTAWNPAEYLFENKLINTP
jgi:hypothetical protein